MNGGGIETSLRLICSMSANHQRAVWEDVTDTTPMTIYQGYARFTTVVSASFWMVYCPNWMSSDIMRVVDPIYKVSITPSLIGGATSSGFM